MRNQAQGGIKRNQTKVESSQQSLILRVPFHISRRIRTHGTHLPAVSLRRLQSVVRHLARNPAPAYSLRHKGMHNVHNVAMQSILNKANMPINKRLKAGLLRKVLNGNRHSKRFAEVVGMQTMYSQSQKNMQNCPCYPSLEKFF